MEVSWHQSSAHTGWLTGDCWAAKSLQMENKLFYSWALYRLSFGFTVSHHSGSYSQREGQGCWIFLLHPNATRQKRWKCDIWMSEKAASAGVFVEIRQLIYKIYGEVTWKQEKKMAPGKIPTTFRTTSQKRTIFLMFWWNKILKPSNIWRLLVPHSARWFKTKGSWWNLCHSKWCVASMNTVKFYLWFFKGLCVGFSSYGYWSCFRPTTSLPHQEIGP